ncbi:MAG TPA: hypothetical protein VKA49_01775 [Flavitalea sp.]|nr:hypothetical protein [Flavitalea sp.]
MIKSIPIAELNSLIDNHGKNMSLPTKTKAVFITLDHLKDFISQVEARHNQSSSAGFDPTQVCDTIKICLVRYEFKPNKNQIESAGKSRAGKDVTQISLAMVPVKTADPSRDWDSIELSKSDGVLTLCVCEPAIDDLKKTGLCPPNNGCPPSGPDD